MRKRIFMTIFMLVSSIIMLSGCGRGKQVKELPSKYIVDDKTKIEDDLKLLGMDTTETVEDLALTDIEALFPSDVNTMIYFSMPKDTSDEAYRVEKITINNETYNTKLVTCEGYYQKYIIEKFKQDKSGTYEISEINFVEENTKETSSFNVSQEITAKIEEKRYVFDQEYHYSVVLSGQNFESVYQFNKDTNVFVDLWAKIIPCVEKLDEDKRSFYYFAFNCYDPEKDIYFLPEDILQLDVNYTLLTYQYKGKDEEAVENLKPKKKIESQTITADSVSVLAKDEKRSNKKLYKYETINKLSDADLTQNVEDTNAGILSQAARQYDWAVAFGSKEGYPYKKNKSGWILTEYDIDYSKIQDFKTIKIKYRVDGKKIETKTSSLVRDEINYVEETHIKPSKEQKIEYDLTYIWKSDHGLLWKIKESIKYIFGLFLPQIIVVVILIICLLILYKIGFKRVIKYVGRKSEKLIEKIKDKLDMEDDD